MGLIISIHMFLSIYVKCVFYMCMYIIVYVYIRLSFVFLFAKCALSYGNVFISTCTMYMIQYILKKQAFDTKKTSQSLFNLTYASTYHFVQTCIFFTARKIFAPHSPVICFGLAGIIFIIFIISLRFSISYDPKNLADFKTPA